MSEIERAAEPAETAGPETIGQLGWDQILADLARRCRTTPGERRARALGFLPDPDAARARMAEIGEARDLRGSGSPLPFGGVVDVREAVGRSVKGAVLEPGELVAVGETARGCDRLQRHLREQRERAPRLFRRAEAVAALGHVFHPILDAFDEAGRLHDHASDELAARRKHAAHVRGELDRRARDLLDDRRWADALQDRFFTQRDERCVLPIKVEARSRVRGIVHGTSHSGQTVFIEPEALVELGNQLVLAQHAVADEERRILAQLSSYVAEDAEPLLRALDVAAELDAIAAAADQADALSATAPAIDPDGGFDLQRARHPLMELGGRPCVPNDVRMARGVGLVVSGPNAGGKTVSLKTTGLAVLMARAGLHVAAGPASSLPWIERVESDIGDPQSLEKDLSTFSGHLVRLAGMLRSAGPRTLVLLDELCVGTEPEQGAALAQAVLEALVGRGAQVMVATHYERLKALAATDPRFANASVGFDLDAMLPTFQLHLGVPGTSGALALARRLELDGELVARAETLLGARRADIEELLVALADERERLSAERAELDDTRAEADRALAAAQLAEERARERERKVREGSHDEAVAALRDARRELDELRVAVRRRKRSSGTGAPAATDVRELGAEVDAAAARIAAHAPARAVAAGEAAPDPSELRPGVEVRVVPLSATGAVVSPAENGRVAVQIGALRTTVSVADVRLVSRREQRREQRGPRPGRAAVTTVTAPNEGRALRRSPDATLDLRGDRVDDALSALDRFLDDSMRASREVVFVIHGHGTGALRNAIRQHVGAHPAVSQFRPGEQSEGGDGVTVAWLDV
ncbi:MAG TPA: Smr/MutS family protein [Kofleriaceae bacterium]|nr:Smr/MutS family protein [Kofleriaceae bacterium]